MNKLITLINFKLTKTNWQMSHWLVKQVKISSLIKNQEIILKLCNNLFNSWIEIRIIINDYGWWLCRKASITNFKQMLAKEIK